MTDTLAGFRAYVRFESIDPVENRRRFYDLTWQPALFGEGAPVRTWGRLGQPGPRRTAVSADRCHAQPAIRRSVRRRLHHGDRVANRQQVAVLRDAHPKGPHMQPLHPDAQVAIPPDDHNAAIYRALILQSLAWWHQHGTAVHVSETAEAGVFELSLSPRAGTPAQDADTPPLRGSVWVEVTFLQDDHAYVAPVSVVWALPAQAAAPQLAAQQGDAAQLPAGLPWASTQSAGDATRSQ